MKRKGDFFSLFIQFSFIKKEENEEMEIFSSSFRSVFLFIWRNWGEEKRKKEKRSSIHFLLPLRFSRFLFFMKESGKRNWIRAVFLNKSIEWKGKRKKKIEIFVSSFHSDPLFYLKKLRKGEAGKGVWILSF